MCVWDFFVKQLICVQLTQAATGAGQQTAAAENAGAWGKGSRRGELYHHAACAGKPSSPWRSLHETIIPYDGCCRATGWLGERREAAAWRISPSVIPWMWWHAHGPCAGQCARQSVFPTPPCRGQDKTPFAWVFVCLLSLLEQMLCYEVMGRMCGGECNSSRQLFVTMLGEQSQAIHTTPQDVGKERWCA